MVLTHLLQKGLNSESTNKLETSTIVKGFLKSGLSVPNFNIASSYVILSNGKEEILKFEKFLKTSYKIFSVTFNTSSWVANAISKSSW